MSKVSKPETDFIDYLDSSLSVEVRLESLKQAIISNEGLNLDYVSQLEKISPGCIMDNKPRALIIHEPNERNLEFAVESIDKVKLALTVGVIGAIMMMIIKFFSRFGSGSEGGGGGGGGGGGYNNLKDPVETTGNLIEKDEKLRRQVEENVEKLKDSISSEVMLKANIKSDTIHLLKKCGMSEQEIEKLTANEHALQQYLLNPNKFQRDVFWNNGGNSLPKFLTAPNWATNIAALQHLVDEIQKVTKRRWDFALTSHSYFGQLYESIDGGMSNYFNYSAPNQYHSVGQNPQFNQDMKVWTANISMQDIIPNEPHIDLEAIKYLSKQLPIPGFEVTTDFTLDLNRGPVIAYLGEFVRALKEPGTDNSSTMPNYLDFSKRLDDFSRVVFKAQSIIIDLAQAFELHGKSLQTRQLKIENELRTRNEIPIELRNYMDTYLRYTKAQFDLIGKLLAAFMNMQTAFETIAKHYHETIEALRIVNTDLDNLQKRLSKARDEIEKEKLRNDVHRH